MTRRSLCAAAALAFVFAPAEKADAKTLVVNCDAGKTISWGLSQLATAGSSVLKVNGTCRENVSISGFHNLEIAANGAELWPAPSGPGTSWVGTYVMEVVGSSSVTIKGLTVHAAGALMGISFRGCVECFVKNCFVDGSGESGVAFSVVANSSVIASAVRTQGRSGFWISDASSAHVEGSEFDGGGMGWAGIMAGQAGVATVQSSVFRNAGVGLYAENGGVILATAWSPGAPDSSITIQNNWCGGVGVHGGEFSSGVAVLVSDNGSERCAGSGVWADSGGRLALSSIEVRNQHGSGISLSGQSHASLGGGIKVTDNLGSGLFLQYDSIAVGPATWDTSTTVLISGNGGSDLWCDDSSRITGKGHFPGAVANCLNFVP
jgi:hypothetical protein